MADLKLKTVFNKAVTNAIATKFKNIEKKLLPIGDAKIIGAELVTAMKQLITRGISPIKSVGRFPAYKNPKDGYPSTAPKKYGKKNTPVNLTLTGDQLRDLSFQVKGNGIEIGYSEKQAIDKEQGHRDGVNGQPKRPTLPKTSQGEEFAQTLQNIYLRGIRKNIKNI